MDSNNNDDLLKELKELGVDPRTGRKSRSDKGIKRGPHERTRSDKGLRRPSRVGIAQEPVHVYNAQMTKLLNKTQDETQPEDLLQFDHNGIYLPMVKRNVKRYGEHHVINHSVKKIRSVRHIQGRELLVEAKRFNALQDLAITKPLDYPNHFTGLAQSFNVITYSDLFCTLYHISLEDMIYWSFDRWLEHYNIVKEELLSPEFKFNLKYKPGTPEFMPEFAEKASEDELAKTIQREQSREYQIEYARVRDLLYERAMNEELSKLMTEDTYRSHSMAQLSKIARERVAERSQEIEANIKLKLNNWLNSH